MMDPVSYRIGRHRPERQNYAQRAHDKRVRQRMNELVRDTGWKGDLARSVREVIDIDDCTEMYRHAAE